MKVCGSCRNKLPLENFAKNPTKTDGKQWQCKNCQAEYRKEHYKKNKEKYIKKAKNNTNRYKKQYYDWLNTQSCVDCGNSDIRVLEQDHLSNKKFNIASKVGSLSLESLMIELEKCETVCANCHRIRTVERGKWFRSSRHW